MKLEQKRWDSVHGWIPELTKTEIGDAQLILIFSAAPLWREQIQLRQIKDIYPHAHTFGCSTAGEICVHRTQTIQLLQQQLNLSIHKSKMLK